MFEPQKKNLFFFLHGWEKNSVKTNVKQRGEVQKRNKAVRDGTRRYETIRYDKICQKKKTTKRETKQESVRYELARKVFKVQRIREMMQSPPLLRVKKSFDVARV